VAAEGALSRLRDYNAGGSLGMLQIELEWRLFDFCRIHQIVYREISEIDKGSQELVA